MSTNTKLLLIVVLMTMVLGRMIFEKEWLLATGTEIVLKLEPRDPRSLFRGDYMRLTYEIDQLDGRLLSDFNDVAENDTIFVAGQSVDGYWTASSATPTHPRSEESVLRGRIERVRSKTPDCEDGTECEPELDNVTVRYGLDTFFVAEGTGRALEDRVAEAGLENVRVLVRVSKNGSSALKAMLINGEPVYENRLF